MKKIIVTLTLFNCFVFAACKKDKTNEDQLPPATQTGANTFGCLVNGKVFVPKGYDGRGRPNPYVIYAIGLDGNYYLNIDANQYSNTIFEGNIFLAYGNVNGVSHYNFPSQFNFSVIWPKIIANCGTVTFDSTLLKWGGALLRNWMYPIGL